MPLIQDGLEYWFIVHKFVESYVSIWYTDDESIKHDNQLKTYWSHFYPTPLWIDYKVPELTKENLIEQLTHSIFYVTAGNEFVSNISEYLKNPTLGFKIIPNRSEIDVSSHFHSNLGFVLSG
jgi:hypothetical protein